MTRTTQTPLLLLPKANQHIMQSKKTTGEKTGINYVGRLFNYTTISARQLDEKIFQAISKNRTKGMH